MRLILTIITAVFFSCVLALSIDNLVYKLREASRYQQAHDIADNAVLIAVCLLALALLPWLPWMRPA